MTSAPPLALYIVTATAPDGRTALFATIAESARDACDAARLDPAAGCGRAHWTFTAHPYHRKVIFLYVPEA